LAVNPHDYLPDYVATWGCLICGQLRDNPIHTSTERVPMAIEEPLLQFFTYEHLRADLQGVSKDFAILAARIVASLPRNPERTVALRKLLEAKDCAVRAKLWEDTA
jgi:hypothetical protein